MTKSKTTSASLLNGAFGKNAIETTGRDYYNKGHGFRYE